jgi:hypothetical protein
MSFCCVRIWDFKALPSNGVLALGMNATATGVYKLSVSFLGVEHLVESQVEAGQPITFPLDGLNEAFVYIGRVTDPNGNPVTKTEGGVEYECFSFETRISYKVN